MTPKLAIRLNGLALYAIAAISLLALYWQRAYDEFSCPLCMLQRVAIAALAVGPILTIRHGPKPGHYGLVIIAALLGPPSPPGRSFCTSCRAMPDSVRPSSACTSTPGRSCAL
jgi:disulfide bond formation protein DsbB